MPALMRSKVWDRVEQKLHCLQAIGRAKHPDVDRRYILVKVVETYLRLNEVEERRFKAEMEREVNKEVREMVVTWEEALAEREAAGENRGRAEGEAIAKQDDILLVAKHQFHDLPSGFENTIRAVSDLGRLNDLFEQVLKTESLEDVDLN